MRAFFRDNGIALVFGSLFFGAIGFQAWAGWHVFNHDAEAHGSETIGFARYLVSSHFGRAVLENWQSEWLQFLLFILVTMFFIQRGSPESEQEPVTRSTDKEERIGRYAEAGSPRWAKTGGWRTAIYSYSLLLAMTVIFIGSWAGHSVTGWTEYNDQQQEHGRPAVPWSAFVRTAEFWEQTLQNWQSEFLAVGTLAIFSVFLRARHSAESKPVGAPHAETGTS
jgi:magnesium-transporting ATPase (P-type)